MQAAGNDLRKRFVLMTSGFGFRGGQAAGSRECRYFARDAGIASGETGTRSVVIEFILWSSAFGQPRT